MNKIKKLNEKLLWEVKDDDEKPTKKNKNTSLKAKEYRDTYQNYKGRISGTAMIDIDYRELKKKLEEEITGVNWTLRNVKKVFTIITQMIDVRPQDEE